METIQLTANGLVFDALTDGPADGRLVVLLHGFPQTSWSWRGVIPPLVAAGCRVVAPDQRGYSPGARPDSVSAYRMPELVADVVGMLDALGADRADVVGHDWGAAVAWQLAARHPGRVRTLTPVSVPHPLAFVAALRNDEDQRQRSAYMQFFRQVGTAEETLLADDAAALRGVFGQQPGVDGERYAALMREPGVLTKCLNWYRAQDLSDIEDVGPTTVPTLYVWSDEDVALGPAAAHATADHVSAPYRFELLHGISHWIPEQAPDRLAGCILEHLAAHPA
jgi:pimeloyl-ACP methyl ester carboxylesterase